MKTVLITGISRGIGKATAEKFRSEGWKVYGTSTTGKKADFQLELSSPESIKKLAKAMADQRITLDVLINNAAHHLDRGEELDIAVLRKILEINLIGIIDFTERVLPLINDGGHIINFSSGLGSLENFVGAFAPAYQISKTAINMYTKTLAARLKDRKIIVSSFEPGWVKTDLGGPDAPREPEEPAAEVYQLATTKVDSGFFWGAKGKRPW